MYSDKRQAYQHPNSFRGQPNRKSWPQKNSRVHRRTGIDQDGDTDMDGGGYGSSRAKGKGRYTPGYQRGGPNKGKNQRHRSNIAWWKIVVHDADKFDKDHFFKMLDNTTNESIDPQSTRVQKNNKLVFWVKNPRAKDAIYHQSGKLTLKDHTINLNTYPSYEGPDELLSNDELKAKICIALIKRYKEGILDLSEFHRDKDMGGTRSRLYDDKVGSLLGELIKEKCADLILELDFSNNTLKHTGPLRDILGACKKLVRVKLDNNSIADLAVISPLERYAQNITHLSLINNPVKNLLDDAQYISDIRKRFPKLIQLDGVDLPAKIKFDEESESALPATQKFAILVPTEPNIRRIVENFFLQYVSLHDAGSDSRSQLAPAYDEQCLFSVATSWRVRGESKARFPSKMPAELMRKNRNFRLCSKADQKESRLFIGRESVIRELASMGETKHTLQTMNIDTSTFENNHVTAILSGIIDSPEEYRSFSRTFVLAANPANCSFLILNDQLSIIRSTPDAVKKSLESPEIAPATATAPGPAPSSTAQQQELVQRVQAATRMTDKFCVQCLEAANWDLQKALNIFSDMKTKGSIPPDVFLK